MEYVGLASIGGVSRFNPVAEVAVEIPRECFDEKDHLNHRYYGKRMLYLSHVLKMLRKSKKKANIESCRWEGIISDPRKPNISITFKDLPGLTFLIRPTIPIEMFPLHKLAPERNNLRSACNAAAELVPTPCYNAGMVEDMLALWMAASLRQLQAQFPCVKDVMNLLILWAKQHKLMEGSDGLTVSFLVEVLKHVLEDGHAVRLLDLLARIGLMIDSGLKYLCNCMKI